MLSLFRIILRSAFLIAGLVGLAQGAVAEPVKVIFETDMETDCDDAAALAMLHYYADQNQIELLGVMANGPSPDSVAGIDAINTYFGRPDLPIGAYKGDTVGRPHTPIYRQINQRGDLYPHDVHHRNEVPDATALYADLLSRHSDVVIISVGYLQNISELLDTEGGADLIADAVDHMVVVGGSVGQMTGEHNLTVAGSAKGARHVLEDFPRPMIFTPAEVGSSILTGSELSDHRRASPVRAAYDIFSRVATNRQFPEGPFGSPYDAGPPLRDGRPSWDQVGVLLGVLDASDMFETVTDGYMYVEDRERGRTEWRTDRANANHANHSYVVKARSDQAIAAAILVAMDYEAEGSP